MSITFDAPGGEDIVAGARARAVGEPDARPTLGPDEFAALYARHRDAVHRFCRRRTNDPMLLEDIVQDVFEKAFARRACYDPDRDFWPWVASIAVRACIDAHRRSVNAQSREHRYAQATYREPFDATSAAVIKAFDRRRLARRIEALPSRQRAALGLFALDGWSYEQIAQHLGQSTEAVKALIRRARSTLREAAARWIGAGVGLARTARDRLQRKLAQAQGTGWPSVDLAGVSVANVLPTVSIAVAVLALVSGMAVPPRSHALAPTPPAGAVRSEGGRLDAADGTAGAAASTPPDGRAAPSPPSPSSPVGEVEHLGEEVASVLPDTRRDDPESIRVESFASSPDYEHDPTIFVAGSALPGTALLVSHDDAASWQPRRAAGLGPAGSSRPGVTGEVPPVRLLLPPAYPRDRRVFAVTAVGLQVSRDDGESFETLLALPAVTDAAFSPAFGVGDSTMLLVSGERLVQYDAATGAVTPVDVQGGAVGHRILSVGYADAATVLLGSREPFPSPLELTDKHISRCSIGVRTAVVAVPQVQCDSVRLPAVPTTILPLRLGSHVRSGLVYVPLATQPLVSDDGGRTFRPARHHGLETDELYTLYDLAVVPSTGGESAIMAQQTVLKGRSQYATGPQLARTDDGGRTWTSLTVALPEFRWATKVVVTPTGRIVAASGNGGLGCSADGGRSWGRTCPPRPAA